MECYTKNGWDPLKAVILGYFMDPKIVNEVCDVSALKHFKPHLTKIAQETEEDFDNMQHILESHGVTVIRPDIDALSAYQLEKAKDIKTNFSKKEMWDGHSAWNLFDSTVRIPVPIGPRDEMFVYGDTIMYYDDHSLFVDFDQFDNKKIIRLRDHMPTSEYIDFPSVTRVNDHMVFGKNITPKQVEFMVEHCKPKSYVHTGIRGHLDATMAPIREGLLLCTSRNPQEIYSETFPNWKYVYVGENGFHKMLGDLDGNKELRNMDNIILRDVNELTDNSWWIDGLEKDEHKEEIAQVVNKLFPNWFGYSAETYFEVNCLTINPNLSIVLGQDKEVKEKLREYGHETISVPWRNRWFFDQGLHCITCDLIREH